MEISSGQYENNISGFVMIDCEVRSADIFYFSLSEDETQLAEWDEDDEDSWLRRRIVYFIRNLAPAERWGNIEFDQSYDFQLSVARQPREQLVGIEKDGNVYVVGGGTAEWEDSLGDWTDGGMRRGSIVKSRTIDGHVYMVGGGRTVGVRKDRNDAVPLMQQLPFDHDKDWQVAGFEDIDGFNASDIYCVGGKGDVWHFDGASWTQVDFPSTISLRSVCCAGDGNVYISGHGGTTFKGRGQTWRQLFEGQLTIPFNDVVWFDNRVWCTSEYGLWNISDEKLEVADVDSDVMACSGHLSTHDGLLLVAGNGGAACQQDGKWHKLF
ncbi:hypothetical protein INH39_01910 [Massilia violaceinigra]|uniref:Photosynthesis system II assembly factor Ycf48/Hcf136-like domain-containing protein n=1 Tax=Massilia violaceinigra TaxID=2045208 RepID=A0ABY4A6X3_9BURK|nr:hypothetical protein [Massilia violaceinigra]UOD30530.1 hypothetical protein INH39_01910 [Massilia violaceinigra]